MQAAVRLVLTVIGTISLTLGVLGIVLPLLPTTPFLLLASACYLKASPRLHKRLVNHKYLGVYISNIKDKRGLPVRGKVAAIMLLWGSLVVSLFITDGIVVRATLITIGLVGTTALLLLRTLHEQDHASVRDR